MKTTLEEKEGLSKRRKLKKCHKCESTNTKLISEWFYGHRNGVYVGSYQETFYACKEHKVYF